MTCGHQFGCGRIRALGPRRGPSDPFQAGFAVRWCVACPRAPGRGNSVMAGGGRCSPFQLRSMSPAAVRAALVREFAACGASNETSRMLIRRITCCPPQRGRSVRPFRTHPNWRDPGSCFRPQRGHLRGHRAIHRRGNLRTPGAGVSGGNLHHLPGRRPVVGQHAGGGAVHRQPQRHRHRGHVGRQQHDRDPLRYLDTNGTPPPMPPSASWSWAARLPTCGNLSSLPTCASLIPPCEPRCCPAPPTTRPRSSRPPTRWKLSPTAATVPPWWNRPGAKPPQ